MAELTKIQWVDHSSSPWHGCSKVHLGCDNCYAERQSVRNPGTLGIWGQDGTRIKSKSFISNLRKWDARGEREQRVQSVFPSICDPFEDRPELESWRSEMFETIDECPWVRLLLLTKRPENVRRMWPLFGDLIGGGRRTLSNDEPNLLGAKDKRHNVWIGTSVSDQETADKAIPQLLNCRDLTPCLFVSCEPLLNNVDIFGTGDGQQYPPSQDVEAPRFWVIIGGESGPKARPCKVDWIRSIVSQCKEAGVPAFVKQLGAFVTDDGAAMQCAERSEHQWWPMTVASNCQHAYPRVSIQHPKGGDPSEWPEDLRVRAFPIVDGAAEK